MFKPLLICLLISCNFLIVWFSQNTWEAQWPLGNDDGRNSGGLSVKKSGAYEVNKSG
jgi:hypothetical protein